MRILILSSNNSDNFVELMHSLLVKNHHHVIRLNLSNFFNPNSLIPVSFDLNEKRFEFVYKDEAFEIDDFDLVWNRRLENNFLNNVLDHKIYKKYPPSVSEYLNREVKAFKDYLLAVAKLKKIRIINDYNASVYDKLFQLRKAREVGLLTPDFLFTNNKASVLKFIDKHQYVITKPSSNFSYIYDDGEIYSHKTSRISKEDILKVSEALFPSFLQKGIKNAYELKCIYIGGRVYAVKQQPKNPGNTSDIKLAYKNNNVDISAYEIRNDIKLRIRELCNAFNIDICTMDFIIDDLENYYFLEINQDGIINFYSNYINDNIYETFYKFITDEKI